MREATTMANVYNLRRQYVGYVATDARVPLGLKGGAALLLLPLRWP